MSDLTVTSVRNVSIIVALALLLFGAGVGVGRAQRPGYMPRSADDATVNGCLLIVDAATHGQVNHRRCGQGHAHRVQAAVLRATR